MPVNTEGTTMSLAPSAEFRLTAGCFEVQTEGQGRGSTFGDRSPGIESI